MEYLVQEKVNKLRKMYNYKSNKALDIIKTLHDDEYQIVLNDNLIQSVIFGIDNKKMLREIFKYSPTFFQEKMFSNERVQFMLLIPRSTLDYKEFISNYHKKDYVFSNDEIMGLEKFLKTIKSDNILKNFSNYKIVKMLIPLIYEKQITEDFLENVDKKELFYEIINDESLYNTRISRKKNIVNVFNKISNYILLPYDYDKLIEHNFLSSKSWQFRNREDLIIEDGVLDIVDKEFLIQLLDITNLNTDLIKKRLKKKVIKDLEKNNYDYDMLFENINVRFEPIYYYYIQILVEYLEDKEEYKNKFFEFLMKKIVPDEINEEYYNILKTSLYYKVVNNEIKRDDYSKLLSQATNNKTAFFLKFNVALWRMDNLEKLSLDNILKINVKHINQIIKCLNTLYEDEPSIIYSQAIKLYMVFGLEKACKILNGDYGKIDYLFYTNLNKIDIGKLHLRKEGKKFIPSVNEEFINFMFAKENDNHFRNMLNNHNSLLYKYWYYFYNNYNEIKERCHNQITLKKLDIILLELTPSKELGKVAPNNYKFEENDILNDICLGNKTFKSNREVYEESLKIYSQMKNRIESSIPYVKGTCSNGYKYEMMKLNDPIVFSLGYKSNCCFRVFDNGDKHLRHAALCRNGRILIIYDKNNEYKAFVPLKRNGEVLIANSIECQHKQKDVKTIKAFITAIDNIITSTKEQDSINLVCIGTEAYTRPEGETFPRYLQTPTIVEKDNPTYRNTDCYHKKLTIVYKNPDISLNDLNLYNPTVTYIDPRNTIRSVDFSKRNNVDIDNALKVINSVRYTNIDDSEKEKYSEIKEYGINYAVYNDDWYLFVDKNNEIYGEYIDIDSRAQKEISIAYEELKQEFNIDTNVKEFIKYKKKNS